MTKPATEEERNSIIEELRRTLGEGKVKNDPITMVAYGRDVSPQPYRPAGVVVLPESRDDVVTTMKIANRHHFPLTVQSGGVSTTGLTLPQSDGMVLDLRRLNRILDINTSAGYALIEAGVTFDQFFTALDEKGYRSHVTTAPGGASVLGNALMKPSGSLATRHLDSVIDLEVVLPDGTLVKTGSSHFEGCGNSLRYGPFPDLSGLYCCAYGTLGVVTQASIRIYPKNEATEVAVAAFNQFDSAVDFVKQVINANMAEHCIIWSWQLYKTFEISDPTQPVVELPEALTRHPSQPTANTPYTLVTIHLSGFHEVVKAQRQVMKRLTHDLGGALYSDEEAHQKIPGSMFGWNVLYVDYKSLVPLVLFGKGQYMAWIVQAEPDKVKDLEKWAVQQLADLGLRPVEYYVQPFDFGRSFFFRIFCFPDFKDKSLIAQVGQRYTDMYQEAMVRYGAIPYRYRPGQTWMKQCGGYADLLSRIKKAVDPNNILSPQQTLFEEAIR